MTGPVSGARNFNSCWARSGWKELKFTSRSAETVDWDEELIELIIISIYWQISLLISCPLYNNWQSSRLTVVRIDKKKKGVRGEGQKSSVSAVFLPLSWPFVPPFHYNPGEGLGPLVVRPSLSWFVRWRSPFLISKVTYF